MARNESVHSKFMNVFNPDLIEVSYFKSFLYKSRLNRKLKSLDLSSSAFQYLSIDFINPSKTSEDVCSKTLKSLS